MTPVTLYTVEGSFSSLHLLIVKVVLPEAFFSIYFIVFVGYGFLNLKFDGK